ncbi:MarR family winged helix-turn-helix transcriptional regulator [Spirochaeta cellobiosiphila]|uniref:MarR family winged helix-turn-helix transcriptional regulator n=1 Tax=Spirochaeta cellobiosiphila TaxID=504483 RepID=UPI00041F293F|nr:MarR family transcriptional regulator [Spirochaeta cellobiosiphila]
MRQTDYGEENEENLKLVIALLRTVQDLRKNELIYIKDSGLTIAQFGVLETLYHKGDMRVCEIIDKTLSTGGNMTVIINNLIRDGLITRYQDPEDKRAFICQLTEKGEEIIMSIWPKHLKELGKTFKNLSLEEKRQLRQLMKKLNGLS